MNKYTVGTLVRLSARINAVGGGLADPTLMVCKVKAPDGTVSPQLVTRSSQGSYFADFLPTTLGLHMYEFIATGDVQSAAVGQLLVTQDLF